MAKLQSAAEFNAQVDAGKYANKVNAQRAAGRTRLPDAEKKKVFAYLETYFGAGGGETTAAKPSKKASKKAAKKAAKKVAAKPPAAVTEAPATPAPVAAAPAPAGKVSKRTAKKAASRRGKVKASGSGQSKAPPGTLPISPSEVNSVADVLSVVDSTVQRSERVIEALKRADELSKSGDINKGVEKVKRALEGAADLLLSRVVAPLSNASNDVDPEVAQRLEQVVAAAQPPPPPPVQQSPENLPS